MQKCNSCIVFYNQPQRHLTKGESLFLEGADVSETYLINKGVIKVVKVSESGNEFITDLLVEGDKVALVDLYEQHVSHNVSAIALTPCEVVVVNACHFNAVCTHAKDCILSSCYQTVRRRESFRDSILYEEDVERKILKLMDYLYDLFGSTVQGNRQIALPFSRSELCGLIGVRRETFSRKLSALVKKGEIQLDKNIIMFK
ncbi:MAG: Crp/Fnr family transcriptional regulator [Erysipelotrichaceae bacterium]